MSGEPCTADATPQPVALHQSSFAHPPPFASLPFAERKHIVATLWSQTPFSVRHSLFACEALLRITVCDPSCGSGHFLLAAARRLAEKLAELRAPDGAVRPDDYRHALREAASRCLYGVDINPMAVELCRVALWLETVDPGKPLGFLNHHIRSGNSLLGTTPDLIAAGLPDETFTAIEGDDKPACSELKKRNKAERAGFGPLFAKEEDSIREKLRQAATAIEAMDDSQPAALQQKEAAFLINETAPETRHAKLLADLWCAAFVIKKRMANGEQRTANVEEASGSSFSIQSPLAAHHSPEPDLFGQLAAVPAPKSSASKQPRTKNQEQGTAVGITTATLRQFVQSRSLPEDLESEVNQLASQYRFFHWHLAFPQVFDHGGFDCILGNPPWEKVNLKEQEWFAEKAPGIVGASNASVRKRLIAALKEQQPLLAREFQDAVRHSEGESHVLRSSGSFPLCGRGDINLYAVFAEQMRNLLAERGLQGCIVQSDIATSETYQFFFTDLLAKGVLISFFDFVNTEGLFPAIHRTHPHFCLLTIAGKSRDLQARFSFWNTNPEQLADTKREFMLSDDDIRLLNPNTRTCPIFHSASDAELTKTVYRRVPIFLRSAGENDWDVEVGRMFHSSDDSDLFIAADQAAASEMLFLYESKCFSQFDHRFVTFEKEYRDLTAAEKTDPSFAITTKNAVQRSAIPKKFTAKISKWLLAYRRITNTTNERTLICATLPESGLIDSGNIIYAKSAGDAVSLLSTFNSFVLDFLCRQSMGGTNLHLYILEQLPVLPPATYAQPCPWAAHPQSTIHDPPSLRDWLLPRVLELTYTAWDLEAFASDCGWPGPPFRWDEDRRFLLRCELDAAFFHLYLGSEDEWRQQPEALTRAFPTPRHAVSYIMDTFPIVKRKDEAKHGTYRTKETILQIYDTLAESMATGIAYQTVLDPVPASFRSTHPPQIPKIARNTPKEIDDIWQHFVVHFLREAGSEATLALFREAWHRFADLSRYQTELSAILSEEEFANWQRSNPVAYTRPGFHEFVSNLVGSNLLAYNESSQVISFTDDAFDGIVAEPWIQTEVSLSLRLLAQHPEVEKWLPKAMAQHPVRREVALREFLTAAS